LFERRVFASVHFLVLPGKVISFSFLSFFLSFFLFFFFRERERAGGAKGEGEREPQADSPFSGEPDKGLDLTTLRS